MMQIIARGNDSRHFPLFFYKTGCFEVSVVVRMQDCVYADIILC